MLKLEVGIIFFTNIQWMVLIPIYLCLSPLCMISSELFDWTLSYIIDDQTITLLITLILQWAVSAILILQLLLNRTCRTIFFYEFIFFITCSNCILIGVTYSLLKRQCIYQETMAKICTTLLFVLLAEKMKFKYEPQLKQKCVICFNKIISECIFLKCKHVFHESCLWNWVYVKQQCPTCRIPI